MDVQIVDPVALSERDPSQFALYLRSRGWVPAAAPGGTLWRRGEAAEAVEILVPSSNRMRGYAGFIRQLMDVLQQIEGRSQLEILRDVSLVSADVQYLRTFPSSRSGSVPLSDAPTAIDSIREWILSAAVSVVSPLRKPIQPARKPNAAIDFMRTARLGPSYEGSYIWSVEIPLPPRLAQESLPFEGPELRYREQPFERKVSLFLYNATSIAHRATELVKHEGAELDAFTSQVEAGVTANLCEALAGIGGESYNPFQVSFQWAPTRPRTPTEPLHFDAPSIRILGEAAAEMRANAPEENVHLIGNVVRLHREGREGPGEVNIAGVMEGDPREKYWRVWVQLPEGEYNSAIHAHDFGRLASVRGDLVRRGNRLEFVRFSAFEILPDEF